MNWETRQKRKPPRSINFYYDMENILDIDIVNQVLVTARNIHIVLQGKGLVILVLREFYISVHIYVENYC